MTLILEISEFVFAGLKLDKVYGKGMRRSFIVESVNGSRRNVAKYCPNTRAHWPGEGQTEGGGEAKEGPGRLEVLDMPGIKGPLGKMNGFLRKFGVQRGRKAVPPSSCGIVIQGSRGTGKTMLLNRLADTRWGTVKRIKASDKPQAIQDCFRTAIDEEKPVIILIDDIRNVVNRERPVASEAVLDGLEELAALSEKNRKRPSVLVVATCRNYFEDIPEAFQTERTFQRHVTLTIPDVDARKEIIQYYAPNFPPAQSDQYVSDLGDRTHAYTGHDLRKLLVTAYEISEDRTNDSSGEEPILWADIQQALHEVRPTAMHDITLKPPTVRWKDIGGYEEVKNTLQQVLKRSATAGVKWKPPKGVLMYGPPGCSKTMTAQAVATESGFNFFAVKGGELLNMYVGETERSIRNLFQRAREASPSVIFFDEIDSIAGNRSSGGGMSAAGGVQAVTTLLTEMDGFEEMGNVFVLAATNKPDSLDPALMRPGRFDELIYVPLPDEKAREAILTRKAEELQFPPLDVLELAKRTNGYSGAEISRMCDKAFMPLDSDDRTSAEDDMAVFERAIRKTPKGVTIEILSHFTAWRLSRNEF